MQSRSERVSVDLAAWPDLVVIYLGMRVTRLRGIMTLLGIGREIDRSVAAKPDGLLAHEMMVYGLTHVGMRQYWRDLESLEAFTRSEPHRNWWRDFLKDNGGTGFWHETYRKAGGMEAIYLGLPKPIGLASFAPARRPIGPFMTAGDRIRADAA
jgi:hypothetical protein